MFSARPILITSVTLATIAGSAPVGGTAGAKDVHLPRHAQEAGRHHAAARAAIDAGCAAPIATGRLRFLRRSPAACWQREPAS